MSPESLAIVVGAILFGLLALRVPVGLALGVAGTVGLLSLRGFSITDATLGRVPYSQMAQYLLIVIPMFIFMGTLAKATGIAESAFRLARHYLRKVPAADALAGLFGCAVFAAVSGSSTATVVSVGRLSMTEMLRHGYTPAFTAGVIGASGTLGILIPPSVVLIIYGVMTGTSISRLFLAGIVPGIVSALFYGAGIMAVAKLRPAMVGASTVAEAPSGIAGGSVDELPPRVPDGESAPAAGVAAVEFRGLGRELLGLFQIVTLFVIVMGGIYSGFFTTTEAAAVGAAVTAVMLLSKFKAQGRKVVALYREAVEEAISLSGMVFLLLIGAGIFTLFVTSAGYPHMLTRWALGVSVPDTVLVLILLLAFIPMGMFLDPLSILLIAVPLTYPVVESLGFNLIWYGILVVKMIELGLITPPLGINAFVVSGVVDGITPEDAFRGLVGFAVVDLVVILLIFFVPAIVLWVPPL